MQAQRANRRRTAALIAAIAVITSVAGGYAPAQAADEPDGDQTTVTQTDPVGTTPVETPEESDESDDTSTDDTGTGSDDADPAGDEVSTENDGEAAPTEPDEDSAGSTDRVQKSVAAAAAFTLEAGDTTIVTRHPGQPPTGRW